MTLRLEGAGARRIAEETAGIDGAANDEEFDADEEEKFLPLFLLAEPPLPPPFLPPAPLPPTLTMTFARSTAGTRCSACAERTRASS